MLAKRYANSRRLNGVKSKNLTLKNNTILAQYGITKKGYGKALNYLENTIDKGAPDELSSEEHDALKPYIEFARKSTIVTTIHDYFIQNNNLLLQGETPNKNLSEENAYEREHMDIFLNNDLYAKQLLDKEQQNRKNRKEMEDWDNSIVRRTVYGALMTAQILNDVFGHMQKVKDMLAQREVVDELYKHERKRDSTFTGFKTKAEFDKALRGFKQLRRVGVNLNRPTGTPAALEADARDYTLRKGGEEAELLLRQLVDKNAKYEGQSGDEIRQQVQEKVHNMTEKYRNSEEKINPESILKQAIDDVLLSRSQYLISTMHEQYPTARMDAIYAVAEQKVRQEMGDVIQQSDMLDRASAEFPAMQKPEQHQPLQLPPPSLQMSEQIQRPTPPALQRPGPDNTTTFSKISPVQSIRAQNAVREVMANYTKIVGAAAKQDGDSRAFECLVPTQDGILASDGAAAPITCLVGDIHVHMTANHAGRTSCTKEKGCANISATEWAVDPTTNDTFPVKVGLLALATSISEKAGLNVRVNLEGSHIGSRLNENTNYTFIAANKESVDRGGDSALMHTLAVARNCYRTPQFIQEVQQGKRADTTCHYDNNTVIFHLFDQRYNRTSIDSLHYRFIDFLKNASNPFVTTKLVHTYIIDCFFNKTFSEDGLEARELLAYMKFLYTNSTTMGQLFEHPTYKRYSTTHLRFSQLPPTIVNATYRSMSEKPVLGYDSEYTSKQGMAHMMGLIKLIEQYFVDKNPTPVIQYISKLPSSMRTSTLVNFQQFMPDVETIRTIMSSRDVIPISQFGSNHMSRVSTILTSIGWFKPVMTYMASANTLKPGYKLAIRTMFPSQPFNTPASYKNPKMAPMPYMALAQSKPSPSSASLHESVSQPISEMPSMASPSSPYGSMTLIANPWNQHQSHASSVARPSISNESRAAQPAVGGPNPFRSKHVYNELKQELNESLHRKRERENPGYGKQAANPWNRPPPSTPHELAIREAEAGPDQYKYTPVSNFSSSSNSKKNLNDKTLRRSGMEKSYGNNTFSNSKTYKNFIKRYKRIKMTSNETRNQKRQERRERKIEEHKKMISDHPYKVLFDSKKVIQPMSNGWFDKLSSRKFRGITNDQQEYLDAIMLKPIDRLTDDEAKYMQWRGVFPKSERPNIPGYNQFLTHQEREREILRKTMAQQKVLKDQEKSFFRRWAPSFLQPLKTRNTLTPSNRQRKQEGHGRRTRKNKK